MVYLLGNPVIFWGNLVVLGLFLLMYTVHALRRQRGCHIQPQLLGEKHHKPETEVIKPMNI